MAQPKPKVGRFPVAATVRMPATAEGTAHHRERPKPTPLGPGNSDLYLRRVVADDAGANPGFLVCDNRHVDLLHRLGLDSRQS
jgi:hypothetical protein